MNERNPVQRIQSSPVPGSDEQNVQGWERIGSVAGGVVMVGKGLRRGGVFGLIQVAIGGVALARGITGHSSAKSLLEKARQDMSSVRGRIERAGEQLNQMKNSAQTGSPNDTPKA